MPLKQKVRYRVWKGVNYIQGEGERIIGLLKDVRLNLSMLNKEFKSKSLKEILELVEKDKINIKHKSDEENPQAEIIYSVNLSDANQGIINYRHNSEGGCKSCSQFQTYMPFPDEHVSYCGLYEKFDVVDLGSSPRIAKFYEQGCDEKKVKIPMKLEEVINNHKE
jgi:hypothetical protein